MEKVGRALLSERVVSARFAMCHVEPGTALHLPERRQVSQSYELLLFNSEYLPQPMIKSFDISFRRKYFTSRC